MYTNKPSQISLTLSTTLATLDCPISVGYHLELRVPINSYQLSYITFFGVHTDHLWYLGKKMILLVKCYSNAQPQMATHTK